MSSPVAPPAPSPMPSSAQIPALVAELQARVEALFIEARGLEGEVIALRAAPPLMLTRPGPLPLPLRVAHRILPRLARARAVQAIRGSGLFDADWYLARNPDVAAAGVDPAQHFLDHGARDNRDPSPHFSVAHYLALYPDIRGSGLNPLLHYLRAGWDEGRSIRPGMPHRGA